MNLSGKKVTSFITRKNKDITEILLFKHPFAGIQFPAGTVEPDEEHNYAAVREATEETALTNFDSVKYIGHRETILQDNNYYVARKSDALSRPDHTSAKWAFFRTGITVKKLREIGIFSQITYEEVDKFPDPEYLTYVITGWVESENITQKIERHFYHLTYSEKTEDHWKVFIDDNNFELFWVPLNNLPEIVYPQNEWLPYVINVLNYKF